MEIAFIIWMLTWFAWLLYESKWLTVRLLVGLERFADSAVTDRMKGELLTQWPLSKIQHALFGRDYMQPLFGWGYCWQYKDFKPVYEVELVGEHYRTIMHSNDTQVLRDAFRVNRNPYLKVKV